MNKIKSEYVPGTCNIGPAEIRSRLLAGWLGAGFTAVLLFLLFMLHASPWWALLVFLPSAGGAVGFFQAAFHFCAAFGMRGVFNFGNKVGEVKDVAQEEFHRADMAKAVKIIVLSALTGAFVATLSALLLFARG
jgi:hypothetical protein